jgi:hypothetical protein
MFGRGTQNCMNILSCFWLVSGAEPYSPPISVFISGHWRREVIAILQILCCWTLAIVLFLFKTQRFGVWFLFPSSGGTYSGQIDRASLYLRTRACEQDTEKAAPAQVSAAVSLEKLSSNGQRGTGPRDWGLLDFLGTSKSQPHPSQTLTIHQSSYRWTLYKSMYKTKKHTLFIYLNSINWLMFRMGMVSVR